ncbi:class I SAM-dependent methyltransferase [Paenibacillus nasutitermitis]|uniref:Methyltransferase n=1 Tax=Paenibacillus nasutitermitis TaxID=1652958 RepID=A0A916Z2S5_9BACL|nr:class I SAM-dependent methyltransferase [Paenibacillus nasutitermitis]GGD73959.1 methyltransferase [Paenibacillus nasutitermitis]
MSAWYERSFGSDYMIVYRHRNWEQASSEVGRMAGWLELPEGARVLDIGCGMGRHALALANLGYRVTGVDLSEALLEEAREQDKEGRLDTLIQGDMRHLPIGDGQFQATVNLFTSFGYFEEQADNHQVLKEIRRVLTPDGRFLIDFLNPDYVKKHLVPHSRRIDEPTGLLIDETRVIRDECVRKQIIINSETDGARRYEEHVRLLSLDWFEGALSEAGLTLESVYGDYEGRTYDKAESPRMIMTGKVFS